jgi:hypothetical protein
MSSPHGIEGIFEIAAARSLSNSGQTKRLA